MLHILESGQTRRRDLVFVASADEEAGGADGVGWLLEEHWELFADAEAVLNEAGVNRVAGDRLLWWGIETAQKQVLWLRVMASGRGGHGSGFNPASPTHRLVRALNRVLELEHPWRVTTAAHEAYRGLATFHSEEFAEVFDQPIEVVQAELDRRLRVGGLDRVLLPGMSASFRDTVQITRIDNGAGPVNVAPGEAVALIDARLLPDTDADAFRRQSRHRPGYRHPRRGTPALGRQPGVEHPERRLPDAGARPRRARAGGAGDDRRRDGLALLPPARRGRLRLLALRRRLRGRGGGSTGWTSGYLSTLSFAAAR